MKTASEILQKRLAEIADRTKAQEAQSPQAPASVAASGEQLPIWAEPLRGIPNELVRSALFNVKNRNQKRVMMKETAIVVIGNGLISYTGEELRQDDETVWLQLVHMAKVLPVGEMVELKPIDICKALKWSVSGQSYKRIRDCLIRMQATALSVESTRLKEGVSLSMIPYFRWKDEKTGKASTTYKVKIAAELLILFADHHFTRLEWEQRLKLPSGLATWLHAYYASHRDPYPIKIETIVSGSGMGTVDTSKIKQIIQTSLDELEKVGFITKWEIIEDKVFVTRA